MISYILRIGIFFYFQNSGAHNCHFCVPCFFFFFFFFFFVCLVLFQCYFDSTVHSGIVLHKEEIPTSLCNSENIQRTILEMTKWFSNNIEKVNVYAQSWYKVKSNYIRDSKTNANRFQLVSSDIKECSLFSFFNHFFFFLFLFFIFASRQFWFCTVVKD